MQIRQLGTEGPKISCIGFGAWPIGGGMGHVNPNTAIEIVRTAINHGITLIDTAQAYRNSEEIIGQALKDGYRDRCFLCLLYTSPSPRDGLLSRMPSSA